MGASGSGGPGAGSLRALDALNFFLADVRDGLGPYLAVYLEARHWERGRIGVATAAMLLAVVLFQVPAGAWIDRTRRKRLAVAGAAAAVAAGCVAMVLVPSLPVIVVAQAAVGVASTVFAPAVAALSLGIVGRLRLAARTGRNEAFNHAGNVAAAALAAAGAYVWGDGAVFWLVAVMAGASAASVARVREADIDHARARGADDEDGREDHVVGLGALVGDRRIAAFTVAAVLFHFANAAMLPLAGQKASAGLSRPAAAATISACIIAAQVVMVPVALASGRLAESWGRKPLFLAGLLVLPVRGLLYTLGSSPALLVGVQLLDGLGAGIFGVVSVLIVADLTRGTGRFNVTQGAIAMATGLGAALSNLLAEWVAGRYGFDAAFVLLAAVAVVASGFFAAAVPETHRHDAELRAEAAPATPRPASP